MTLTSALVADVRHDLGRALDVDLHAGALEPLHDDAHPPERRDELKRPDYTQLQEVRMLS